METVKTAKGEIKLDFDRVTGRVMINCEKAAKKNDPTMTLPALSMTFQAYIAAEAAGKNIDDILNLPGPDFTAVTAVVQNFLINSEQTKA